MEEHNQIVMDNYPTDSFQYLFWKTQYEAIKTPRKLMRCHPSLILLLHFPFPFPQSRVWSLDKSSVEI